jgi:serine/threonine protein kinase
MTDAGSLIAHRYRLVNRIAAGGMGLVWEAWDELLRRRVAVKQLLTQPGLSEDEVVLARNRVIREARITARLHHPHAVTLYDVVEQDGYPCLIMQFVPSRSLSALLSEQGSLQPAVVARIGADVASALAAAHEVGIVHRDVKPGNVLITEDGSAKLTDFGISHAVGDITLTSTGMLSGTPAFLAPEVARGGMSGFAADVFSLGATLYAALEGTPPFGTDQNPMAILHRVASGQMIPPRRSGPLTPLLLRMMAPEPTDRPAMIEVAHALAGQSVDVPTPHHVTPTTVTSAQTVPELRAEQTTAERLLPAGVLDVAPVRPSAPTESPVRRRPTRAVLAVLAVLLAAAVTVGFFVLKDGSTGQNAVATTSTAHQPAGPTATAPTPSAAESSAAEPSVPEAAPTVPETPSSTPKSSPASPTTAANSPSTTVPTPQPASHKQQATTPPSAPTATDLVTAVKGYYALMPGNTDKGWARLTPAFQTGIAQDRQYYESFWSGIKRVVVSNPSGNPPDTAEATITYYFTDGKVTVERTAYRLVQDGGILKLDNSTVLSSQTR